MACEGLGILVALARGKERSKRSALVFDHGMEASRRPEHLSQGSTWTFNLRACAADLIRLAVSSLVHFGGKCVEDEDNGVGEVDEGDCALQAGAQAGIKEEYRATAIPAMK